MKGTTTKLAHKEPRWAAALRYKLNELDSERVYNAQKCVPIRPRNQLLNRTDCVERDLLLSIRKVEKIIRTSLGMFRYKEIVYVVIIFLEHLSQVTSLDKY
jgi:hypothetical protein